jgi:hypothetical protein
VTVFIFSGPTLSHSDVRAEIDAVSLPPVAQGDFYRVAKLRPRAIGIVDGYFERMPAVWHKEILWAMAQGVHVYGSASMGALRAAELGRFGMVGVGWVFEQFRDELLEDDDEVAIAHGAAETGYLALSEAMVNIRRTLAAAAESGIIGHDTGIALTSIAKNLYYPERSYPLLLRCAADQGVPPDEIAALQAWLPGGRLNQKRTDALAMLRMMRGDLAADPGLKRVSYYFEHTIWWDRVVRFGGLDEVQVKDGAVETLQMGALIDELRLDGRAYGRAHDYAALRLLSLRESQRRGFDVPAATVEEATSAWRRGKGLSDSAEFARWLEQNQLTPDDFSRLMREEVLVRRTRSAMAPDVTHRLIDDLVVAGAYGDLLARARDKLRVLAERDLLNPALEDAGIERSELLRIHFEQRGQSAPDDLALYAANAGFAGEDAFLLALLREWCYVQALNGAESH